MVFQFIYFFKYSFDTTVKKAGIKIIKFFFYDSSLICSPSMHLFTLIL